MNADEFNERLRSAPSWIQFGLAARSVLELHKEEEHNAQLRETTTFVQLLPSELALVALGNVITSQLFPEVRVATAPFSHKLEEVGVSQGVLPEDDDDWETFDPVKKRQENLGGEEEKR